MIFKSKKGSELYYKFRDLKVYSSTEWLAESKKKYRTVFESQDVSYIYTELSFFNKQFDEEEWNAHIQLKCYRIKQKDEREERCVIDVDQKVSPNDAIVYIREGWGYQEKGLFWTAGTYIWEAFIDDELVGTTYFYVENMGSLAHENRYFEVKSIRLYEGSEKGVPITQRNYLKKFNAEDTRYVWVEFTIENYGSGPWFCELFFNFVNENGQIKGQAIEFRRISEDDDRIVIVSGWGSETTGSWHPSVYSLNIVFMDTLVGKVYFEVGDRHVDGIPKLYAGDSVIEESPSENEEEEKESEENLEDIIHTLHQMVGLRSIKKRIQDYTDYLKFVKIRKLRGLKEPEKIGLHAVFKGNPGTGKTTVAKMLGKIYKKLGLLSKGKVVEVGRAELVGQYIGQTAPKVKEVIEKARGGVLFIDEAYSLIRNNDDSKDYGHEVVETLVKEMSDGPGDLVIVVAGYPNEMEVFLGSNPGLKSRFNLYFDFDDYLPQELSAIALLEAEKHDLYFDPQAKRTLDLKITDAFRKRDRTFGNARVVISMIEQVKIHMGLRVMKEFPDEKPLMDALKLVIDADVRALDSALFKELPLIDVDEELLTEALSELDQMIGLRQVKEQVKELVQLVRFYRETGQNVLKRFSLHSIFKGNPGTGKTTVARIIAKIYKALGILEKGHIVECDRQSLVAGYVGQTAIKTKEKIDAAIGGVLFIDEAYALTTRSDSNDFGREAVEVILKQMEDRRGEFIVIAAGYPGNMDQFLEVNPGLKSRFDRSLNFEDFSVDDLVAISTQMFENDKLKLVPESEVFLRAKLTDLYEHRDKFFGNARAVRKIVQEAVKKQHLRMALVPVDQRSEASLAAVLMSDLAEIDFKDEELSGKKLIGFRRTDQF